MSYPVHTVFFRVSRFPNFRFYYRQSVAKFSNFPCYSALGGGRVVLLIFTTWNYISPFVLGRKHKNVEIRKSGNPENRTHKKNGNLEFQKFRECKNATMQCTWRRSGRSADFHNMKLCFTICTQS